MIETYKDDLDTLEALSIKISDLINKNKFEKIVELDLQRKKIINRISQLHKSLPKNKIKNVIQLNNVSISQIEEKIIKLNLTNNKLKKRIKFYSQNK